MKKFNPPFPPPVLSLFIILVFALISCETLTNLGDTCNQPVIVVTTTEQGTDPDALCLPGQECTLRAALNTAALCGDAVTIRLQQDGVYILSSGYVAGSALQNRNNAHELRVGAVALPRIYNDVVIEGVDGHNATIRLEGPRARFFHIPNGGRLTLRNIILQGGRGPYDAGRSLFENGAGSTLYNEGTLIAENLTVKDSKDRHAVYNNAPGASALFKNCLFDSNLGAVLLDDGQVSIEDNTRFINNTMPYVGGYHGSVFYVRGGELNIRGATIERNGISGSFGAISEPIYIGGGQATIDQTTFKENAGVNAGSINLLTGELSVTRSTFYGERSNAFGAIAFSHSPGNRLQITDVTIHACTATSESGAGGITVSGVSASGSVVIANTVISNNLPRNGGFLYPPTLANTCMSTDGSCPGFTVISNPNFAGDAPGNYGGPTETLLPRIGSPLIDAGTFNKSRQDQRGQTRPFGAAADVGAVERQPGD